MGRKALWAASGILLVGLGAAGEDDLGLNGRFEVAGIVADYDPGRDRLDVEVTLTSGLVLTYAGADRADAVEILQMMDTFARPGTARMWVMISGEVITNFQLGVGNSRTR